MKNTSPSYKDSKNWSPLFSIACPYNYLRGQAVKGETLHVGIDQPYEGEFRVVVVNAAGTRVNGTLNTCKTKKTAKGWAEGNFGYYRIAV